MNGEPLNILLVEDNSAHAELVMAGFEKDNVANRIHHVWDGEEALDYLLHKGAYREAEKYPVPNLVLLDLRLPKIDGLEVLKVIKEDATLRRIPVVVLTTSDAERDVAMAYDQHANSYLVKPLDFEKFHKMMIDLGFYWLAWNRHPGQATF